MDKNWILPADKLAARMGLPRVLSACPAPMGEGEEGYSGAALFRLRAGFAGGGEGSFVCKKTSLKEREATGRLFLQGRGYTPAALSCGPDGEGESWMVMEDIGVKAPLPEDRARWKRQAAEAFAAIHMDNFGKGAEMPWLPAADAEYWDFFTHALSAGHFERFCREDEAFAAEYGGKLPALREAAASFSAGMAALFEAGTANTLTHGDVQTMDGDHVRCRGGRPVVIDFGFCRYAPFFIDLTDYFRPEEWALCWEAYRAQGLRLGKQDFLEGCRTAARYPGFAYLFPALMAWKRGEPERLRRCMRLLGL